MRRLPVIVLLLTLAGGATAVRAQEEQRLMLGAEAVELPLARPSAEALVLLRAAEELTPLPEKPRAVAQSAPPSQQKSDASPAPDTKPADGAHRFWDRRNLWLFAGVAAMRALDYHSTGNMRRRGREEILLSNEVVDNKPVFATIQVAATATSVGLSYLFHRTNHHRLERWVSYLHISVAGFGAVRNYCLKSYPIPPASP